MEPVMELLQYVRSNLWALLIGAGVCVAICLYIKLWRRFRVTAIVVTVLAVALPLAAFAIYVNGCPHPDFPEGTPVRIHTVLSDGRSEWLSNDKVGIVIDSRRRDWIQVNVFTHKRDNKIDMDSHVFGEEHLEVISDEEFFSVTRLDSKTKLRR